MDPSGNYEYQNLETYNLTFETVKLQRQETGHSWAIIGYLPGGGGEDFRILGVLEKPIPYSLMVEFVKKVAEEFKATFQEI